MLLTAEKSKEYSERLRAQVDDALARAGVSARRASIDVVGNDGLIRDIRAGVIPSADRLAALFDYLDLEFYFGPRRSGAAVDELVLDDPDHPRVSDQDYALVPRLDVDVSAGAGLVPPDPGAPLEYMAFSRPWLARSGIDPRQSALVRVRGDSMVPTIPEGALVLLDRTARTVAREGIYAFSRNGAAFVKRILPVGIERRDAPASLVIVSDNPLVSTEILQGQEIDEIHIAGRVRCVLWTVT